MFVYWWISTFSPCLGGHGSWIFSGGGGGGRVESSSLRFTLPMWEILVGRRGGWLSPLRQEKSPKFHRTFGIFPNKRCKLNCIFKGENIHKYNNKFEEMSVNLNQQEDMTPRGGKKRQRRVFYTSPGRRRRGLSAHSGGVMRTCKRGKVWWVTLEGKYFQMEMGKKFSCMTLLPSYQKIFSRFWDKHSKQKKPEKYFLSVSNIEPIWPILAFAFLDPKLSRPEHSCTTKKAT